MRLRENWNHIVKALCRAVCQILFTMNQGRYVWFTKQLLALLHNVLFDLFCSFPSHSIPLKMLVASH